MQGETTEVMRSELRFRKLTLAAVCRMEFKEARGQREIHNEANAVIQRPELG